VFVGLAGASTIGTQILTYACAGQFYPSTMRSTGIGWASGFGRSGAILAAHHHWNPGGNGAAVKSVEAASSTSPFAGSSMRRKLCAGVSS